MINKNTGEFTLDSGKTIYPTMPLEKVKSLTLGEVQKETGMRTRWIQYFVGNVTVADKFFNLIFFFHEESLDSVSFVFDQAPFALDAGWGSWSGKKELEKVEVYNEWLNKEIGTDRDFNWGNVCADYDAKGGQTSVIIRFKK